MVLVRYDDLKFPRKVTSCGKTNAEASVVHRSGSVWKWPTNPDNIFYEHAKFCELKREQNISETC